MLLAAHPLMWGRPVPASWLPMAGLGLALIAWFGFGATLRSSSSPPCWPMRRRCCSPVLAARRGVPGWSLAIADAVLTAGELHLAWECYHYLARGARELTDPKSAILYLILVPGLVTGAAAVLQIAVVVMATGERFSIDLALATWLGLALGLLIVTPPLLSLVRPGWSAAAWPSRGGRRELVAHRGHPESARLTRGDWIEILGLALRRRILTLLLFWIDAPSRRRRLAIVGLAACC